MYIVVIALLVSGVVLVILSLNFNRTNASDAFTNSRISSTALSAELQYNAPSDTYHMIENPIQTTSGLLMCRPPEHGTENFLKIGATLLTQDTTTELPVRMAEGSEWSMYQVQADTVEEAAVLDRDAAVGVEWGPRAPCNVFGSIRLQKNNLLVFRPPDGETRPLVKDYISMAQSFCIRSDITTNGFVHLFSLYNGTSRIAAFFQDYNNPNDKFLIEYLGKDGLLYVTSGRSRLRLQRNAWQSVEATITLREVYVNHGDHTAGSYIVSSSHHDDFPGLEGEYDRVIIGPGTANIQWNTTRYTGNVPYPYNYSTSISTSEPCVMDVAIVGLYTLSRYRDRLTWSSYVTMSRSATNTEVFRRTNGDGFTVENAVGFPVGPIPSQDVSLQTTLLLGVAQPELELVEAVEDQPIRFELTENGNRLTWPTGDGYIPTEATSKYTQLKLTYRQPHVSFNNDAPIQFVHYHEEDSTVELKYPDSLIVPYRGSVLINPEGSLRGVKDFAIADNLSTLIHDGVILGQESGQLRFVWVKTLSNNNAALDTISTTIDLTYTLNGVAKSQSISLQLLTVPDRLTIYKTYVLRNGTNINVVKGLPGINGPRGSYAFVYKQRLLGWDVVSDPHSLVESVNNYANSTSTLTNGIVRNTSDVPREAVLNVRGTVSTLDGTLTREIRIIVLPDDYTLKHVVSVQSASTGDIVDSGPVELQDVPYMSSLDYSFSFFTSADTSISLTLPGIKVNDQTGQVFGQLTDCMFANKTVSVFASYRAKDTYVESLTAEFQVKPLTCIPLFYDDATIYIDAAIMYAIPVSIPERSIIHAVPIPGAPITLSEDLAHNYNMVWSIDRLTGVLTLDTNSIVWQGNNFNRHVSFTIYSIFNPQVTQIVTFILGPQEGSTVAKVVYPQEIIMDDIDSILPILTFANTADVSFTSSNIVETLSGTLFLSPSGTLTFDHSRNSNDLSALYTSELDITSTLLGVVTTHDTKIYIRTEMKYPILFVVPRGDTISIKSVFPAYYVNLTVTDLYGSAHTTLQVEPSTNGDISITIPPNLYIGTQFILRVRAITRATGSSGNYPSIETEFVIGLVIGAGSETIPVYTRLVSTAGQQVVHPVENESEVVVGTSYYPVGALPAGMVMSSTTGQVYGTAERGAECSTVLVNYVLPGENEPLQTTLDISTYWNLSYNDGPLRLGLNESVTLKPYTDADGPVDSFVILNLDELGGGAEIVDTLGTLRVGYETPGTRYVVVQARTNQAIGTLEVVVENREPYVNGPVLTEPRIKRSSAVSNEPMLIAGIGSLALGVTGLAVASMNT